MIQGSGMMISNEPMDRFHRLRPTGGDKLVGMSNMDRVIMIVGSNGGTGTVILGTLAHGMVVPTMDGSHGMAEIQTVGSHAGRASMMKQKNSRKKTESLRRTRNLRKQLVGDGHRLSQRQLVHHLPMKLMMEKM